MSLLDIFSPRGNGAVSPLTSAILGLLAWNGVKPGAAGQRVGDQSPRSLEGTLRNSPLGGLFGGTAAKPTDGTTRGFVGALLTGGMMDLVRQFQAAGKGPVVESWIGTGENKPLTANELSTVLSEEQTAFLTERTGLTKEELLAGLSKKLPETINELTPEGRIPTREEISRA
jgi:uncharacterized protein YidB (DUF937 family)